MDNVKRGMKKGIDYAKNVDDIEEVSCGNYEGNLGKYKIYLKELK